MPSHMIVYTHFMHVHSIIDLWITHYPHGYSHALAPLPNVNVLHGFAQMSYALKALHHITDTHFNHHHNSKYKSKKPPIATTASLLLPLLLNMKWWYSYTPISAILDGIPSPLLFSLQISTASSIKAPLAKSKISTSPTWLSKILWKLSLLMPSNTTHIWY